MNLTWHIVRKDVRRMAWPVAGWLAFLLGTSLWMRWVSWSDEEIDLAKVSGWMRTTESFARVAGVVSLGLLVVLAGVLGLEDRMTGSISFWTTRPLSGGRLLRAKLLTALLLLVVAPVVVLMPVWWASGVAAKEWLLVAGGLAGMHATLVLGALTVAALTENLGQQVLAATIWFGSILAIGIGLMFLSHRAGTAAGLEATRAWLGYILTGGATAVALGWQYRARRTAMSWGVMAAGVVMPGVMYVAWPWDWSGRGRSLTADEAAVRVEINTPVMPVNRDLPPALFFEVRAATMPDEFLAPIRGSGSLHWEDGTTVPVFFERGALWGDRAAMRVARLQPDRGPLQWELTTHFREAPDGRPRAGAVTFAGQLTMGRMRARVVYELPVREGARAENETAATRIVGWAAKAGATLLVEERDVLGWQPGPLMATRGSTVHDNFLLVQKSSGFVQALHHRGVGAAAVNGLRTSLRVLVTTPPPGGIAENREEAAGWREGATLVRVRFDPLGEFEREFAALPLRLAGEEENR